MNTLKCKKTLSAWLSQPPLWPKDNKYSDVMILMVPSVFSNSHDSAPKPKAFGGALENVMTSELQNK